MFLSALIFPHFALCAQDPELEEINALYQALLTDYVQPGEKNGLVANMVDYAAIKEDERLASLRNKIQVYPRERLDSQKRRIAFYLNAYNILAIEKVTQHWPLFKLKSLGNYFKPVWTHPVGKVCGEEMTLRKLEHGILRQLDEPRIHFALNCASMSCPDLRMEPYVAERLEQQLSEQTRQFLGQEGKGASIRDNKVKLSSIFKWFEEDFDSVGGLKVFVQSYLDLDRKDWEIDGFLDYDWSVNDHLNGAERNKIKRQGETWFN